MIRISSLENQESIQIIEQNNDDDRCSHSKRVNGPSDNSSDVPIGMNDELEGETDRGHTANETGGKRDSQRRLYHRGYFEEGVNLGNHSASYAACEDCTEDQTANTRGAMSVLK